MFLGDVVPLFIRTMKRYLPIIIQSALIITMSVGITMYCNSDEGHTAVLDALVREQDSLLMEIDTLEHLLLDHYEQAEAKDYVHGKKENAYTKTWFKRNDSLQYEKRMAGKRLDIVNSKLSSIGN